MLQKTCGACQRTYTAEGDFLSGTSRWRICSQSLLWFNCSCGSTLVMKKGSYPWYSPENALGKAALGVFNSLANKDHIPHVPSVVMQITRLLEEVELDTAKVARLLRGEPVISAFLIASANNLKNRQGATITNIEHAVVYVGRKTLKELVQLSGLASFETKAALYPAKRFWREAQLAGFATEQVARDFAPEVEGDLAFLAGSLANIGKLLGAIILPAQVDAVVAKQVDPKTVANWRCHEPAATDHTILGEIAAVLWGLPDFVRDACARHHDLTKLFRPTGPRSAPTLTDVTAVGVQLAHWVDLEAYQVQTDILDAFRARVGLPEPELDRFAAELTLRARSLQL